MPGRKLIIDCDAGVDDCQALMLALSAHVRGECEIVAITTVSGNVHIDKVIRNVRRCLAVKFIEQQQQHETISNVLSIPVYYGASEALIVDVEEDHKHARFWHGNDGIGGASVAVDVEIQNKLGKVTALRILDARPTETTPAAVKLAQLCLGCPNKISIVALGPLTNVALACKLYPESFPIAVKEMIFMGGTRYARGNANLTAEFNAYADPEALQICLAALQSRATMVGWDLTCNHGIPFDFVQSWFGNSTSLTASGSASTTDDVSASMHTSASTSAAHSIDGTCPVGAFLSLLSADIVHKSRHGPWQKAGLLIPDPLAMCVGIRPETVVKDSKSYFATVELGGKRTRGQVVLDYDGLFTEKDDGTVEEEVEEEKAEEEQEKTSSKRKTKAKKENTAVKSHDDNRGKNGMRRNLKVITALNMDVVMSMLSQSTGVGGIM